MDWECIKIRYENAMGNPNYSPIEVRLFCCQKRSICNSDWRELFLTDDYTCVKQFISKKVAPKGRLIFDTVLDELWKYKDFLRKKYWKKDVKKYNVDNFLLQLIAVGVVKLELPKKNNVEDMKHEDDSVVLAVLGRDFVPLYLILDQFGGMHFFL